MSVIRTKSLGKELSFWFSLFCYLSPFLSLSLSLSHTHLPLLVVASLCLPCIFTSAIPLLCPLRIPPPNISKDLLDHSSGGLWEISAFCAFPERVRSPWQQVQWKPFWWCLVWLVQSGSLQLRASCGSYVVTAMTTFGLFVCHSAYQPATRQRKRKWHSASRWLATAFWFFFQVNESGLVCWRRKHLHFRRWKMVSSCNNHRNRETTHTYTLDVCAWIVSVGGYE